VVFAFFAVQFFCSSPERAEALIIPHAINKEGGAGLPRSGGIFLNTLFGVSDLFSCAAPLPVIKIYELLRL
jgi:hypothetical protein